MTGTELAATAALTVAALLAAVLLRRAWKDRAGPRAVFIIAGWTLLAVATVGAVWPMSGARGPFIAMTMIGVAALGYVATGIQFRPARAQADKSSLAPEPSDRASKAWRGWLRGLLAGPIGGIAAFGVGIMWTVWMPLDDQTRIVTGGIMVPFLWGGAMAWTLADDKILRATAVLVGVAVVTLSASALRGFG